jgi:hypothetical protein
MVVMLGRMPLDSYVMLNLLICCLCGEIRGLISQVPRPDFITQGVSPRRDVLYILDEVSDWSNQDTSFCRGSMSSLLGDLLQSFKYYLGHFRDNTNPTNLQRST